MFRREGIAERGKRAEERGDSILGGAGHDGGLLEGPVTGILAGVNMTGECMIQCVVPRVSNMIRWYASLVFYLKIILYNFLNKF